MKLRFSPTSPYVRKVTVMVIETGLDAVVERVPTNVWDPATDIAENNPLGKVPVLLLDDGTMLFDSPVICEYLDGLHDGPKLFPAAGPERWAALRQQALGDGILDASILCMLEGRRPDGERSPSWMERQARAVERALDVLEDETDALAGPLTIGRLTVAVTLGYRDFRFGDDDWRLGRPALADWYEAMADRPSMTSTMPKDPA